MRQSKAYTPQVIILPHWRMEGGAGFYIQDLITDLKKIARVQVGGIHAKSYSGNIIRSGVLDRLGSLSFPIYDGIRLRATIYHLCISLTRMAGLFLMGFLSLADLKCQTPDFIILTSSVQAPSIPLLRRLLPKCKVLLAVQENVILNKGLGRIMCLLLRRADGVLSITKSWSNHASECGLATHLLRNGYDQKFTEIPEGLDMAGVSDLLYVGGGSSIKGFEVLVQGLPKLLSVPNIRIICLGAYNSAAMTTLEAIRNAAHPSSQLDIIGHVKDIRPYLIKTSLLVLPLGRAHFCRPAIEAGFFGKTFVIPGLPGLSDFANDGKNCLTFEPGNINDFIEKTQTLLRNHELRTLLEKENRLQSTLFLRKGSQVLEILQTALPNIFQTAVIKSRDF